MEVIAYKSTFNQFLSVLFCILLPLLAILFFFLKEYLYMAGSILLFVGFLILSILYSRQSKELITLNENNILDIYYGKETKHIPLTDVLYVDFYSEDTMLSTFSYGTLKIITKYENLQICNVANLHHAVTRLTELITIANQVNTDKSNNENEINTEQE